MKTFELFLKGLDSLPMTVSWLLSDLGEAKGMQQLFTKQSPQQLKVLKEHALIESSVSSNRIEGIEIDQKRIGTVIFGSPHLKDRNEEEIQGYQKALKQIHEQEEKHPISENSIKKFHELCSGEIWDAGCYKEKAGDIIEKYSDGRERVRFKTVSPESTSLYMSSLLSMWSKSVKEKSIHPLIALAAFNLDFLCIHPFRDGNGRVSRLILLIQCYYAGLLVGKFISLERLIEENKERYYETLEESSLGWHEGRHNPWPYINYLLYILKLAYNEFEDRFNSLSIPRGAKTELVLKAIESMEGPFTITLIERQCPSVSRDLIKKIFSQMKKEHKIKSLGRGPGALWTKI